MPIKAEVRKRESIEVGDMMSIELELVDAVHSGAKRAKPTRR